MFSFVILVGSLFIGTLELTSCRMVIAIKS